MKRYLRYIVAAAAIGAVAALSAIAMGASGPKATGDVTWLGGTSNDTVIQAIFNAQPTTDGAKGQVSITTPSLSYTGTVTCYYQISDNSARFSGVVTSHTDSNDSGFFEIQVIDNVNGVGNSTPPSDPTDSSWTGADFIGTIRSADDPATGSHGATCGNNTFYHAIGVAGNLQVHQ